MRKFCLESYRLEFFVGEDHSIYFADYSINRSKTNLDRFTNLYAGTH